MICKKCGAQIDDESVFCIHCGTKVEVEESLTEEASAEQTASGEIVRCRKCGSIISSSAKFCPDCGTKTKASPKAGIIGLVCGCLVLILAAAVIFAVINNARKSPVEGVSQKVYAQGMQYLDEMNTDAVKDQVAKFLNDNPKAKMGDIAASLTGVSFELDLGKHPTASEEVFNEAVNKIWKVTCMCHAQEALLEIVTKNSDADADAVQIAASIFKGVIAEQKGKLQDVVDAFKSAQTYEDLLSVCKKADTIFSDSKEENKIETKDEDALLDSPDNELDFGGVSGQSKYASADASAEEKNALKKAIS